jgi:hypothetical protein
MHTITQGATMDRIIVYIDDAEYAAQHLVPMRSAEGPAAHWVLVACAPRMTRRIGKWVSHSARESWRAKWAEKLFERVLPRVVSPADQVTTVLAKGPLPALTRQLITQHGAARVLDVRRPKFGQDLQPVTEEQPAQAAGRWQVPGAVVGLGAVLVLAAE